MKRLDTLYISDLDGTLLGTDSRISPASAQIINSLTANGAHITVATARTPATVVPLLTGIDTTPPAIVMTGCGMWNRKAARLFNTKFVPADEITRALRICSDYGISPFVYVLSTDNSTLDVYHTAPKLNKAEESFHHERTGLALKRFHIGTPPPGRATTHTMLCYAMGTDPRIEDAARCIAAETSCSVCCYPDIFNPQILNLEIFPPGVSKALAVEQLKKDLNAERLVVFGDSLNDLPMLAVADTAVAVGNAMNEVKQAADIIIEPNYTDAVARFIEHDFFR